MKNEVQYIFDALEKDARILEVLCPETGIPLWLTIRFDYLRTLLDRLVWMNFDKERFNAPKHDTLLRGRIKNVLKTTISSVQHFNVPRTDIYFVTSSLSLNATRPSTLLKHFEDMHRSVRGRSIVWESFRWKTLWSLRKNLFDSDIRMRPVPDGVTLPAQMSERIAELIVFINHRLDSIDIPAIIRPDDSAVEAAIRKVSKQTVVEFRFWDRLFRSQAPKLIVLEDGVYGPQKGLLLAASRNRVRSAEFQHGVITPGHVAYNCPQSWSANPLFTASLPDTLLTFGEWWGRQTNLPWKECKVLGRRDKSAPKNVDTGERSDILILGDAVDVEQYLDFAAGIASLLKSPDLNVIFRPHPAVRDAAKRSVRLNVSISDCAANEVVSLPFSPWISVEDQDHVIEAIRDYAGSM